MTTSEREKSAFRTSYIPPTARPRWPLAWLGGALLFIVALLMLGGGLWLSQGNVEETSLLLAYEQSPVMALRREAGQQWVAGDRAGALTKWEEAHHLRPENRDIRESLARTHVALSSEFLLNEEPEHALPHLEAAYRLMPHEAMVVHEYQALRAYLVGRDALQSKHWARAVAALEPLYALDPAYLDVRAMLEMALAGQRQEETIDQAREAQLLSQARRAAPGLRMSSALAAPAAISNQPGQRVIPSIGPLASLSDKHIVVSINAQRMYVYEDGQLLWNWTASTGEAERPTIPGRYRIQSKHENARSNVWSLWMPYWQGLYWAGSVENGIHGQVTFDAGGRLWEGYLGTRITFGCVMISDEHAAMLFEWTEMGTPVSIHWEWDPAWVPDGNGDPR